MFFPKLFFERDVGFILLEEAHDASFCKVEDLDIFENAVQHLIWWFFPPRSSERVTYKHTCNQEIS